MCQPAVANLIQTIEGEWMAAGRMFTGYEVYRELLVRSRASGLPTEPYHLVKRDIHNSMQPHCAAMNYDRILRNVGGPIPAFIYFPVGENPDDYVTLNGQTVAQLAAPTDYSTTTPIVNVVTPVGGPVDDDDAVANGLTGNTGSNDGPTGPGFSGVSGGNLVSIDDDDAGTKPDARGTLAVPSYLLTDAGFLPHEEVFTYVRQSNGKSVIAVCKVLPNGSDLLAKYTVDLHGNVRITHPQLAVSGLDNGPDTTYDFERENDEVLVRRHE